jgi:hypothetical protein
MVMPDNDTTPADDGAFETVLHSFAVAARFRRPSGSEEEALAWLRHELAETGCENLVGEGTDEDDLIVFRGRFVVAGMDGSAAVAGVAEMLSDAQVYVDEVWLEENLA